MALGVLERGGHRRKESHFYCNCVLCSKAEIGGPYTFVKLLTDAAHREESSTRTPCEKNL